MGLLKTIFNEDPTTILKFEADSSSTLMSSEGTVKQVKSSEDRLGFRVLV